MDAGLAASCGVVESRSTEVHPRMDSSVSDLGLGIWARRRQWTVIFSRSIKVGWMF